MGSSPIGGTNHQTCPDCKGSGSMDSFIHEDGELCVSCIATGVMLWVMPFVGQSNKRRTEDEIAFYKEYVLDGTPF